MILRKMGTDYFSDFLTREEEEKLACPLLFNSMPLEIERQVC